MQPEPYLHFDGMTWPNPDDPRSIEWRVRYGQPDAYERMIAASMIAAYKQLVADSQKVRNGKISALREAARIARSGAGGSGVSERRKIYVIESGEYSDYSVLCALESEDDARAVQFGEGYKEMILFPAGQQPRHVTTHWEATAIVGPSAETDEPPRAKSYSEWDWGNADPTELQPYDGRPIVKVSDYPAYIPWRTDRPTNTGIHVKATDRDTALKVCSDHYAKLRAERDEAPPPPPPTPTAHLWVEHPKTGKCLFCDDPQSHPRHTPPELAP